MSGIRRALWAAGLPARAFLVAAIHVYRATLSGWLGGQCRFYPSCSVYADEAVRTRGAVVGSALAAWRVLRCNPFGAGGAEPVPKGHAGKPSPLLYDEVIRHDHEGVHV
jgi:putative membrane protein insertion efficiency factor